jgi:5'(3')-deoxyribonucleotidase
MIIICDVDGVLNDWAEHFIDSIEHLGFDFDHQGYKTYDIESYILGLSKKEQSVLMASIMENLHWWDTLEPLPDAYEVTKSLYTNPSVDFYIATAPWNDTDSKYKIQKLRWMKKHFNFIPQNKIVFNRKKWELPGDLIIEDKPETLIKCADTKLTICHNQPYNRETPADYHFDSWSELSKVFKKVLR